MIESEALAFAFYSGHLTEFQRFPTTKFAANPRLLGVVVFFHLEDPGIFMFVSPFRRKVFPPNLPTGNRKKKTPRKPPMRTAKLALPELSPIVFQLHRLKWRAWSTYPRNLACPPPKEIAGLAVDG